MNLSEAIEIFLNKYEKLTTRKAYGDILKLFQTIIGINKDVTTFTPIDMEKYNHALRERNWADSTLNRHITGTKVFFNWLVDVEAIEKSPARVLKSKPVNLKVEKDRAMSDAELTKILEYARYNTRNYALILFLADTGCRAGGASNLTTDDLDIKKLTAIVIEKGDKKRLVAFGDECAIALSTWLLKRPSKAGRYIFSKTQNPLQPASISKIIVRACIKVGIRELRAHSLRHRKGHQLADAKVAVTVAAVALGHSNPLTTLKHYYPDDWARAEVALQKLTYTGEDQKRRPTIIKLVQ